MHGVVDRVDELPDGRLRVVDYKTGKRERFEQSGHRARFDGGRQIQPGLYVKAVEAVLARPVAVFEYRFPTERGQQHVEPVDEDAVQGTLEVAGRLLETIESGRFLATNEDQDCRFCNLAAICRVTETPWGDVSSPPAGIRDLT